MSEVNYESVKQGFAITGVKMVVLAGKTKKYVIQTATEANLKLEVDPGQEKVLRKENAILAVIRTRDIVKGYEIDFTDVLLHFEALALLEGGVATYAPEGAFKSFKAPVLGKPVVKEKVDVEIYAENVDTSGDVQNYLLFKLEGAEGKPTDITLKDGEFYTPKLSLSSRPASGKSPIEIVAVDALPSVT